MTHTVVSASALAPPTLSAPARWPRTGLLTGIVAMLLTAVLGWMVWDRVDLLKNGREIVLPVVPVDPRDLFRGDYVILGYGVSQVPAPKTQIEGRRTGPLFVTLEKQADGDWKAVATAPSHPGSVTADQVVLRGKSDSRFWQRGPAGTLRLRYGIESYFVPEGTGLELEKLVRDKKIMAVVAVDAGGRSAIKGLLVDGKVVHREPVF